MHGHEGTGYFHCGPGCTRGSHEVVALVSGTRAQRRVTLRWAGNHVGSGGFVHVVRDGMFSSLLSGSGLVGGLTTNVDEFESCDFVSAAEVLAPFGCGWDWHYARVGARGHTTRLAREIGALAVLPHRPALLFAPGVRIVAPAISAGPR